MEKVYISKKTILKVTVAILIIAVGLVVRHFQKKARNAEKEDTVITQQESIQESESTSIPESSDTTSRLDDSSEEVIIGVHVAGAVLEPDKVYFLAFGARVWDAIEAAGGPLEEADLSRLNLADYLMDGEKIYVPKKGEEVDSIVTPPTSQEEEESKEQDLTNINSASKIELMELPGIGETLAERIVQYRKENGPFSSVEEIKLVSGIGESLYKKIKAYITV